MASNPSTPEDSTHAPAKTTTQQANPEQTKYEEFLQAVTKHEEIFERTIETLTMALNLIDQLRRVNSALRARTSDLQAMEHK